MGTASKSINYKVNKGVQAKKTLQQIANYPVKRHYLIIPIAYAAVIYYLSTLPGTPTSGDKSNWAYFIPILFNVLHIPVYAGFAWLWRWSLDIWFTQSLHANMITFILTIGYAVLDEWHQSFVAYRYPSIYDIMLDILGTCIAIWLYSKVKYNQRSMNNH